MLLLLKQTNEKAIKMKKTLQINIGGLSFTIEEDAFEKLNQYLASIKKYFSTYESWEEITSDIEARIAEKFFAKTDNSGIIAIEDVNKIIQSMGSVSDFEAIEEEEDFSKENSNKTESKKETENKNMPNTKFFRDGKRRALGGVLSGLAYKFEIDVVWLRILFIILAFGLIDGGGGGFFFLAYLICWIAFPVNHDLLENEKVKKFYRNPENKVLGGVATGLSSYLGIDLVVIRILFVVTGFFFIGVLIYIIFWIIAPNATSLTQKMELVGKPVTLENIETSIKSNNLNSPQRTESIITKLLLFPFRIIGIILKTLGKLISPLSSLVKIFAGLLLLILGASLSFATLVATGAFFGLVSDSPWMHGEKLLGMFTRDFPAFGGFFAFLVAFIPAISIFILGLSLLTRQIHGNRNFWLTTLTLWFAGLVGLSTIGSKYAMNFSRKHRITEETILSLPQNTLILDLIDEDYDDEDFFDANVILEASKNNNLTLERKYSAKGRTQKVAAENAKNIKFEVIQNDSTLLFAEELKLKGEKVLRGQHVYATLKIPKGKKFKMSSQFARKLWSQSWKTHSEFGIDTDDIQKYTFMMDNDNEMICADCPKLTEEEKDALRNNHDNGDFFDDSEFENVGENNRTFQVESFKNVELGSSFISIIKYGKDPKVEAFCDDKNDIDDLEARVKMNTLEIGFDDTFKNRRSKINLIITTPNLSDLEISGAAIVKIYGFDKFDKLNLSLSGASKVGVEAQANEIRVDASGASNLLIKGETKNLYLELSGASHFKGKGLKAEKAIIDAGGASQIEISDIKDLKTDISGGSVINKI